MDDVLLRRILESPQLPVMPAVAIAIIEEIESDRSGVDGIARTVSQDPGLAARILRVVNSPLFGNRSQVSTIPHALMLLGLVRLKTLALGFTLVNCWSDPARARDERKRFWKHSLYAGVAAKTFASRLNAGDEEQVFMAGLLQNIGMLVMDQALDTYDGIWSRTKGEHRRVHEIEREHFGLDHAVVGGALAEQWNLPDALAHAIRGHVEPEAAPPQHRTLVQLTALGSLVADLLVDEDAGRAMAELQARAAEWFALTPEQVDLSVTSMEPGLAEARSLFDLDVGEVGEMAAIVARANEAMLILSLEEQRRTGALVDEAQRYRLQSQTDALCGIANRGHFDQVIANAVADGVKRGQPVSLVMLDLDHFKAINDSRGHAVGDRTLVSVSKTIAEHIPGHATLARYGGEEFALILPGTDWQAARHVGEQVRDAVARTPIKTREGDLHVTLSAGVATTSAAGYVTVRELIVAADRALYEAKAEGRNCVRVAQMVAPPRAA